MLHPMVTFLEKIDRNKYNLLKQIFPLSSQSHTLCIACHTSTFLFHRGVQKESVWRRNEFVEWRKQRELFEASSYFSIISL